MKKLFILCVLCFIFLSCKSLQKSSVPTTSVQNLENHALASNEISTSSEIGASSEVSNQSTEIPVRPHYPTDFVVNKNVKPNDYREECFVREENVMKYVGDERYTYRLGMDISRHDKKVNWKKAKKSGREFVFLRIGWTGYQSGIIHTDERFHKNIKGALKAGFDVGVYYFSQAINEEEAIAEARNVIKDLSKYKIQLPVVYDPESIPWEWARTDDLTSEQVMKNTLAFCNEIKNAGYEPMIYSNLNWEVNYFDLEQLNEYKIWYADYREVPKTPYHFEFLQYDGEAVIIPGVKRKCDGDIQLIKVSTD